MLPKEICLKTTQLKTIAPKATQASHWIFPQTKAEKAKLRMRVWGHLGVEGFLCDARNRTRVTIKAAASEESLSSCTTSLGPQNENLMVFLILSCFPSQHVCLCAAFSAPCYLPCFTYCTSFQGPIQMPLPAGRHFFILTGCKQFLTFRLQKSLQPRKAKWVWRWSAHEEIKTRCRGGVCAGNYLQKAANIKFCISIHSLLTYQSHHFIKAC